MNELFESDGLELACHLARPPGIARVPGLVLCHGFPREPGGAATAASTYPDLADRLAREVGWAVFTFNFRGSGTSEGDFSIRGWLEDIQAAVDYLEERSDVASVWLAGSSLGGALAICCAARDERVRGVATLAAPANLREWERSPTRLLEHAREIGLIRSRSFPPDDVAWGREFAEVDSVASAGKLGARPLLLVHGASDDVVPVADVYSIAKAVPDADLHVLVGAGHRLRHDPRTIAILIGWLARQLP